MSEHHHQCAVVKWFKYTYPEYADCIIAIPNALTISYAKNKKAMFAIYKRKLKEGFKPGTSDLFIAVPRNGKCGLWVEMKDMGKTQKDVSKEQQDHLDKMGEVGYEGIWSSGSEMAIAAIKVYMN